MSKETDKRELQMKLQDLEWYARGFLLTAGGLDIDTTPVEPFLEMIARIAFLYKEALAEGE